MADIAALNASLAAVASVLADVAPLSRQLSDNVSALASASATFDTALHSLKARGLTTIQTAVGSLSRLTQSHLLNFTTSKAPGSFAAVGMAEAALALFEDLIDEFDAATIDPVAGRVLAYQQRADDWASEGLLVVDLLDRLAMLLHTFPAVAPFADDLRSVLSTVQGLLEDVDTPFTLVLSYLRLARDAGDQLVAHLALEDVLAPLDGADERLYEYTQALLALLDDFGISAGDVASSPGYLYSDLGLTAFAWHVAATQAEVAGLIDKASSSGGAGLPSIVATLTKFDQVLEALGGLEPGLREGLQAVVDAAAASNVSCAGSYTIVSLNPSHTGERCLSVAVLVLIAEACACDECRVNVLFSMHRFNGAAIDIGVPGRVVGGAVSPVHQLVEPTGGSDR